MRGESSAFALAYVSKRTERHNDSDDTEADDERLPRHEVEVHQEITSEPAGHQSPHEHPPARTKRREHCKEQSRRKINPDIVAHERIAAMPQRILKKRADGVEDGEHFEPFAGAPQIETA